MIESGKIIEHLDRQKAVMQKLEGEKLGGFYLIVAPDGTVVESIILGSEPAMAAFYTALRDRCAEAIKNDQGQFGAVSMPRGVR